MYKSLFESAVSALAQIDYALEIEDDGCNDTERTLFAIAVLKGAAKENVLPKVGSPLQKLGSRLIDLLDGEQFLNLEQYLLAAQRETELANIALRIKTEEHDCCAEDYLALRNAANSLLDQIDRGDFFDSHGHSAKMLKATHDLMRLLTPNVELTGAKRPG